jgi:cytochrome c oxidase subunit 2
MSRLRQLRKTMPLMPVALFGGGCSRVQSIFDPGSVEADRTALLAIILIVGAVVIFVVVMAFVALAALAPPQRRRWLAQPVTIFSGGVIFPIVTLSVLLGYGLSLIRSDPPASAPMRIEVKGEQWWWRVAYPDADGQRVESANEVRVPVGRDVRIELTTADVIHSFWVPRLAGKVDMIPGRTNVLQFRASKPGAYRGQCAEYCGGAHALMGLRVVAMPEPEFGAWLSKEKKAAAQPEGEVAQKGLELFRTNGCPACHTVTGIEAVGRMGPDLTHVAGRQALAAERLPMSKQNLARWIAHSDQLKPNNLMPSFAELPEEEIDAIATYLSGLR